MTKKKTAREWAIKKFLKIGVVKLGFLMKDVDEARKILNDQGSFNDYADKKSAIFLEELIEDYENFILDSQLPKPKRDSAKV